MHGWLFIRLNPSTIFVALADLAKVFPMNVMDPTQKESQTPGGKRASHESALTAEEQQLNNIWREHKRTDFYAHNRDKAIRTMEQIGLLESAGPAVVETEAARSVLDRKSS